MKDLFRNHNADFFVLRTPLLPFEAFFDDKNFLFSEQELDAIEFLIRKTYSQTLLQEAIYFASPVLYQELVKFLDKGISTDAKDKKRLVHSLFQYLIRMSSRCTPFGLFGGLNVGHIGKHDTQLVIKTKDDLHMHLRIDMDTLCSLSDNIIKGRPKDHFTYRSNSSLYYVGQRIRYIETANIQTGRKYRITTTDRNPLLDELLKFLSTPRSFKAILQHTVQFDVPENTAIQYIESLIDAQLIVNTLDANVTGDEYIYNLRDTLNKNPSLKIEHDFVKDIIDQVTGYDKHGVPYLKKIKDQVKKNIPELDESKLFQMDMFKRPVSCQINESLIHDIKQCCNITALLMNDQPHLTRLEKFKKAFEERYETATVKLTDVLDAEIGINYDDIVTSNGADPSNDNPFNNSIFLYKFRKFINAVKDPSQHMEITDEEIERLGLRPKNPVPHSISAVIKLHKDPTDRQLGHQSTLVEFRYAGGPSAANLLGRFCYGDSELAERTRELLDKEQEQDPNVIYAEVAHVPQARIGNVLARPKLREHQIIYLSQTTDDDTTSININDLFLKLEGKRLVMFSSKLKKEVVPRLSSAHNYTSNNLQTYHFLCDLQKQNIQTGMAWNWEGLKNEEYLPRVIYRGHILSTATWNIKPGRFHFFNNTNQEQCERSFRELRKELNIPKYVFLSEGDNDLLLDLDLSYAIDLLRKNWKKKKNIKLKESIECKTDRIVKDTQGLGYFNELIIPLTATERTSMIDPKPVKRKLRNKERAHHIGSEWTYFKIHTGRSTANSIIKNIISPLSDKLIKQGVIDKWFFIRYADPKFHLRVRFRSTDKKNLSTIILALNHKLKPLLNSGEISELTMHSYKREWERYGYRTMDLAEELFYHNSVLVSRLLKFAADVNFPGDKDLILSILVIDRILNDFGLPVEEKASFYKKNRNAFALEFNLEGNRSTKDQIQTGFRAQRKFIASLLQHAADSDPIAAFDHFELNAIVNEHSRSAQNAIERVRSLLQENPEPTLDRFLSSQIHMFVNRFVTGSSRFTEFIAYEYLDRYYSSEKAKNKNMSASKNIIGSV